MKIIKKSWIKKHLPVRQKNASKIESGSVLLVAGAKGLYGAGVLCALAATRSGVGYTHLMTDLAKFSWLKFPDFIVHKFSSSFLKEHSASVIGIGPGLGLKNKKHIYLQLLIKNQIEKVVVDGDALTFLSQIKMPKIPSNWILTPHEGELARLMNVTSNEIKKERLFYVQAAQQKYGCIILLKGAETLIANQDEVFCVDSGTLALAKAGSGDVLTGMICAFYAQNNNATEAAILGSYVHGHASKLWMDKKKDYLSMRPLDLIELIPEALYDLRKK